MGKLDELLIKLNGANEKVQEDALLEIIRRHKAQLVDLNIGQLMHGENSEGGPLGEYRSDSYKRLKEQLNPTAGGKVDVRLTGDFQNSFFLEADQFPVNVFATDPKTGKLSEHYDNIFGFNSKSKEEIVEDIRPEVQDYYRDLFQV